MDIAKLFKSWREGDAQEQRETLECLQQQHGKDMMTEQEIKEEEAASGGMRGKFKKFPPKREFRKRGRPVAKVEREPTTRGLPIPARRPEIVIQHGAAQRIEAELSGIGSVVLHVSDVKLVVWDDNAQIIHESYLSGLVKVVGNDTMAVALSGIIDTLPLESNKDYRAVFTCIVNGENHFDSTPIRVVGRDIRTKTVYIE